MVPRSAFWKWSATQRGTRVPHMHPEITMSIASMGAVLDAYERHDLDAVNEQLRRSCQRLADAGCDFFVCPDNTAHIALDASKDPYPLPWLHICDIVAQRAVADGRKRVGLLGTKWTMEGPAYPAAFARHGLELRVPSAEDRAMIDRMIFGELCQGLVDPLSRDAYVRVIGKFRDDDGCDAVALSCTEIPLLVPPDVSPLPTLDSTRLLARAAVQAATDGARFPA